MLKILEFGCGPSSTFVLNFWGFFPYSSTAGVLATSWPLLPTAVLKHAEAFIFQAEGTLPRASSGCRSTTVCPMWSRPEMLGRVWLQEHPSSTDGWELVDKYPSLHCASGATLSWVFISRGTHNESHPWIILFTWAWAEPKTLVFNKYDKCGGIVTPVTVTWDCYIRCHFSRL